MALPDTEPRPPDGDWSAAERLLLDAAATGTVADASTGTAEADDPAGGTSWGAGRTVRAEVLADLLTGRRAGGPGRPRAVRLRGARVTGVLDLEAVELDRALLLTDCHFDRPVDLRGTSAPAIGLPGCHLPGLAADRLRTTGDLTLDGVVAEGAVTLVGARVGGNLSLRAARLAETGGYALRAEALTVTESMWCRDGFTAVGEVQLAGARIGGRLSLVGARLSNPGGRALTADGLTVGQNMTCRDGFTAEGEVRLPSAHLGRLSLVGARLSNPGGRALTADGLTVDHDLDCRDGFTAGGQIHLRLARVGGTLDLTGARLDHPGGEALTAARITVGHDLFCRDLTCAGEVRMPGARVGGRLDLTGARLSNPGRTALTADRLAVDDGLLAEGFTAEGEVRLSGARVGGALVLAGARLAGTGARALNAEDIAVDRGVHAGGCTAEGEVRLSGARIGGDLDLGGARLSNPGGVALHADSIAVAHCLFGRDGFTAEGQVRMLSARIGAAFSLEGATLDHPEGDALYAVRLAVDGDLFFRRGLTVRGNLQLSGARVAGLIDLSGADLSHPGRQVLDLYAARAAELHLLPARPPDGVVNLTNAQVGVFADDEASWPDRLLLRGFTYDALQGEAYQGDAVGVRARLRWLARDPGGYTPQLYDRLAAAYRRAGREDAARRVAIAEQWRRRAVQGRAAKAVNWLLYLTVGYGYRTWLAAFWLAGLVAVGTAVFGAAHPHGIVRADAHGPAFSAVGYTLDTVLPIVDLGQQKAWQAQGAAMYWSWAFTAAGWVLTTAVVAGLTGSLKRD